MGLPTFTDLCHHLPPGATSPTRHIQRDRQAGTARAWVEVVADGPPPKGWKQIPGGWSHEADPSVPYRELP